MNIESPRAWKGLATMALLTTGLLGCAPESLPPPSCPTPNQLTLSTSPLLSPNRIVSNIYPDGIQFIPPINTSMIFYDPERPNEIQHTTGPNFGVNSIDPTKLKPFYCLALTHDSETGISLAIDQKKLKQIYNDANLKFTEPKCDLPMGIIPDPRLTVDSQNITATLNTDGSLTIEPKGPYQLTIEFAQTTQAFFAMGTPIISDTIGGEYFTELRRPFCITLLDPSGKFGIPAYFSSVDDMGQQLASNVPTSP